MYYCPYCATAITEETKKCPSCKKLIDIDEVTSIYQTDDESDHINTIAARKIWFTKHQATIFSVIFFFIGFVIGGVVLFIWQDRSFASERGDYQQEISQLKAQIEQVNNTAASVQSDIQGELKKKNDIISVLSEQRTTLTRIINFTRRFASNSVISSASADETDTFRRNFRYLERQFENQQEQLDATDFTDNSNFNLETIPQVLEEN